MKDSKKVFDFHIHVGTKAHWKPWVYEFFLEQNPNFSTRFSQNMNPDYFAEYLKEQNVQGAVFLAEYAPNSTGVITNEFIADFCKNRDNFIPFGALNVDSDIPFEQQAESAVNELGIRGYKMLPTYAHYYPNDKKLWPFYEVVQSLKIPLQFHTGISIFKGSRIKYGDPLLLDDVADDFPDLMIVLDHGGRSFWYDRANWMVTRHKNVYIGITGVPAKHLIRVFPALSKYPDRFIFGSDWPGVPDIASFVEKIRNLPLDQETIEMILWKNAYRLLEL